MNTYLIKEETLTDIADAIREQTGDDEPIQVSDFASEIQNISVGEDLTKYFNIRPQSVGSGWLNSSFITGEYPDLYIPETSKNIYQLFLNWTHNKTPKLIFGNNITSLYQVCKNNKNITTIDCTGWASNSVADMGECFQDSSNITEIDLRNLAPAGNFSMYNAFSGCTNLTYINLSNIVNVTNLNYTFYSCSKLQTIDIRNMLLTNSTSHNSTFTNIPKACLIIVKDNQQKAWINTNFSNLTNVQTVEEYEEN